MAKALRVPTSYLLVACAAILRGVDALHAIARPPQRHDSTRTRVRGGVDTWSPLSAVPSRTSRIACLAKKKGGKKGKAQKQSGFAWASTFELKPTESASLRELVELAASTYRTRTGKSLDRSLDRGGPDVPKAIWAAPLCLMVVRAAEGGGAVVTYANPAAAEAFGLPASDGYKSLIESPTTLPAALVDKKYDGNYEKKLASVTMGSAAAEAAPTFTLRAAERWALEKMAVVDGKLGTEPIGTAYCWKTWELADGTTCEPGGVRTAPEIDPADVAAAVEAQGSLIRQLKADGLTNGDDAVKDAVARLLELKALLPPED